jgi:hypothetical protein
VIAPTPARNATAATRHRRRHLELPGRRSATGTGAHETPFTRDPNGHRGPQHPLERVPGSTRPLHPVRQRVLGAHKVREKVPNGTSTASAAPVPCGRRHSGPGRRAPDAHDTLAESRGYSSKRPPRYLARKRSAAA